jgi:uncharacterized protein (TIGR02646 family)
VRHIELGNFKPSKKWLEKSDRLTRQLIALHEAGDIAGRNKLIKNNEKHWGQLKKWLLNRSYNKCWFSEAREKYSHMDVEHFRPKTEAKSIDGTIRDGYWWLAFDYENLRACGNVGNRKKGGFFPLKEGSLVSKHDKRCEESEDYYLLDPTDEDDVALLGFNEEGLAKTAPGASPWEEARVEETVQRMKLNEHEALTEARRKVWQRVTREIELYETAKSRCSLGGNPAAKMKAVGHVRNIREMTRKEAELSSVALWCVHLRNDPRLSRLVA